MIRNRKLLLWFIRHGKLQANILYFFFITGAYTVLLLIHSLIFFRINKTGFFEQLTSEPGGALFVLVFAFFVSRKFYNKALVWIHEDNELKRKGLTREDIKRINFIKDWNQIRAKGLTQYAFVDGGIMGGILLAVTLLLTPFILIEIGGPHFGWIDVFYTGILAFMMSYGLGALTYALRWYINERKFKQLTLADW